MSLSNVFGGRRGGTLAAAVTAVLLVVGVLALAVGVRGQPGPPAPDRAARQPTIAVTTAQPSSTMSAALQSSPSTTQPPVAPSDPPAPVDPSAEQIGPFLAAAAPTGIQIPSIGVTSTVFVDLGVASDGTITVPGSADEVGFYTGGPTPGQLGPAVLAGHVDSAHGPGVFYRLGAVKPGDVINVSRADGSITAFRVDKVATYPKDQFPTEEVYRGDFTHAQIRLVTCGGTFDKVRHYLGNVVVFAHLESAT
jgi:Sortase domain